MTANRLLIVDDEADFGAAVRMVAERLGFDVEVTTHGREFQQFYKSFDPTAVVVDIIMPEIDGIEIIAWLASVRCVAPIIIISGFTPLYAKTAVEIGQANGLLSITRLAKPVSLAALTAALTAAVRAPDVAI